MIQKDPLGLVEAALLAEELSSAARHEVRNQLAIVRGAAYFIRRKAADSEFWEADPRVSQFFTTIDEHIEKANVLLDGGNMAERLFLRRPEPTDILSCAHLAVKSARVDARVRFEVTGSSAPVHVDPAEGALAVRCLLENAAQAMPSGGTAIVRGHVCETGREVEVAVIDSGEGFLAGAAERALEPFFTTKAGRPGLGLNIAQRICRRYGGSLSVSSGESGVTAALVLPVARASLFPASAAAAAVRILLVDDNEGVRLALSAVLEDEGYEVDTAASFAEARQKVAPDAKNYALVLLDRHLGDRNGSELVPLIRAAHPTTRLVMLSGSSGDHPDVPGVDASVDKGSDLDVLLKTLKSLTASASS